MAWEDIYGRAAAAGSAGEELKLIRDFVSHGEEITHGPLLTSFNREFGKETKRFHGQPIQSPFVLEMLECTLLVEPS